MYDYLIESDLNFIIVPTKADKIAVTKVPDKTAVVIILDSLRFLQTIQHYFK